MRKFTTCGLVVVSLALAACGGGGDDGGAGADDGAGAGTDVVPGGTFEGDGYYFSYPATWTELEPEGLGVGSEVTPDIALGPPLPGGNQNLPVYNVLSTTVGQAGIAITNANLSRIAREAGAFVRQLADGLGGRIVTGVAETTLAGLPAIDAEVSGMLKGHPVRLHMTFAWDGKTQYQFNCQYTQSHAEDMKQGCDQVLDSFQVD